MAYNEKVLDHYENPRNVGSFPKTEMNVGTGMVGAPSCGDVMKLQIKVKNGVIEDAKFKTFGCGSAIASSSLATEWLKGKSIDDAQKIKNRDIATELGLPPVKWHCSVLAEDAIKAAIEDYEKKASTKTPKIVIEHNNNYEIDITKNALERISNIFNENVEKIAIRFGIKEGGCSGKEYIITLDDDIDKNHINLGWKFVIQHDDVVIIKHILIDSESLETFKNTKIDYVENDFGGGKFVFDNPNASNPCGCKKSFS